MTAEGKFTDRKEAGALLAEKLVGYRYSIDPLVLALPNGGVPIAMEVCNSLGAPLDTFIVRKLRVPGKEELAMGAIASNGARILNESVIKSLSLPERVVASVAAQEQRELERQEWLYHHGLPAYPISGKTVFLVDDGLATGASMGAAILAVREQNPLRIVIAVPVACETAIERVKGKADDIVVVYFTKKLQAVSMWYEKFPPVTDEEVERLLRKSCFVEEAAAALF